MKIGIVGDGVMGGGIVQVVAQSGYEVLWKGFNEVTLSNALERLDKNLLRLLDKEVID
ncbi:MAG: 3-hydroxybutyryl-CoA dehydrogenase, partial [Bacteroidales bacterium]|nr:3-hydroxybutyryl-CoA dehydrogenase [Bacteroidales bacterium]